jgi:hypothetical protein
VKALPVQASAQPEIAGALAGTWQARHPGDIFEELTFEPLASNGVGRFYNRKRQGGRQIEQFEGRWRLYRNPLLPPDSRWQVHLDWHSRPWGQQSLKFAIRHLSRDRLALGNIFLSSMNTEFRRVGR